MTATAHSPSGAVGIAACRQHSLHISSRLYLVAVPWCAMPRMSLPPPTDTSECAQLSGELGTEDPLLASPASPRIPLPCSLAACGGDSCWYSTLCGSTLVRRRPPTAAAAATAAASSPAPAAPPSLMLPVAGPGTRMGMPATDFLLDGRLMPAGAAAANPADAMVAAGPPLDKVAATAALWYVDAVLLERGGFAGGGPMTVSLGDSVVPAAPPLVTAVLAGLQLVGLAGCTGAATATDTVNDAKQLSMALLGQCYCRNMHHVTPPVF